MNLPQLSTSWANQITTTTPHRIKTSRHLCTDPNPKPGKTGSQNIAHMMSKINSNSNIRRLCQPQLTLTMIIQRWTTKRRTLHTQLDSLNINRLIMKCSLEPPLKAIIEAEGPRIIVIRLVGRFERIFMSSHQLSQPIQDSSHKKRQTIKTILAISASLLPLQANKEPWMSVPDGWIRASLAVLVARITSFSMLHKTLSTMLCWAAVGLVQQSPWQTTSCLVLTLVKWLSLTCKRMLSISMRTSLSVNRSSLLSIRSINSIRLWRECMIK